jgi:hypothetical protein
MYLITLDLPHYKDIVVSRHRIAKAASKKLARLRKKSERQPAMKYHLYRWVC